MSYTGQQIPRKPVVGYGSVQLCCWRIVSELSTEDAAQPGRRKLGLRVGTHHISKAYIPFITNKILV